jgi:hypothetical protein
MSTSTYTPSTFSAADDQSWWKRLLVPLGVGLAVITPLAMWWRRRHHNGT